MISEKKRIGKLDKTEEKSGTHHHHDTCITSHFQAQSPIWEKARSRIFSLQGKKRVLSFASSCVGNHFMGLPIMANQLKSQIIF